LIIFLFYSDIQKMSVAYYKKELEKARREKRYAWGQYFQIRNELFEEQESIYNFMENPINVPDPQNIFTEEDTNTITVQKPMAIMASGQGVGLGPFAFTIHPDSKVKLNKTSMMFVHKTDNEMAKQYVSSTTGIQMA